ncbi:GMC oxidoreductase [Periconia macrospinosa]|uniref:GMC oxidoreductase n=1 Tax=Periconia macrospinosa TaxID=97972 RepID=A0A2V1DGB5_9PLEO|nr:GMC oxidoreductase [Periconia macrospinosa]
MASLEIYCARFGDYRDFAWPSVFIRCAQCGLTGNWVRLQHTIGLPAPYQIADQIAASVLVIEYGELSNDPSILLPAGTLTTHPERMYNLTTPPIPGLSNRTANAPAGAVVGGGSAVNGMFFDRGSASDYDAWEILGNPGWGFTDLLPYFKKSVRFTPPASEVARAYNYSWDVDSAYGQKGPVQNSYPPYQFPGMEQNWEMWAQLGIPRQKEGADGNAIGVFSAPSALDPVSRTRSYARTAHYDAFKERANYHLLTRYQVTEILFKDDLEAVGVNVVKRGTAQKIAILANKETILAAGAIWTPWLLQRSGLGPKSILEAANVSIKKDFPGVGANFQDHPFGGAIFSWRNPPWPTQASLLTNQTFYAEAEKEYRESRTGPLTVARGNQAAFLPLQTIDPEGWEDLADAVLAQNATPYLPPTYDENLIAGFEAQQRLTAALYKRNDSAAVEFPFASGPVGGFALMRVLSRGFVGINTTSPGSPPLINYRTFSNPLDMALAVSSVRFSRKLNAHPALADVAPVETAPGANVTEDIAIEAYLRDRSITPTFAHASGSTSMLPEGLGGVVAPDLTVYGTKRLSVVDAGIFPFIPATHLCTTVYAVAEKAADLIKERND